MRFINPPEYDKRLRYSEGDVVSGADGAWFVFFHKYWRRRGVHWPEWWTE